jgi:hypothetical protein
VTTAALAGIVISGLIGGVAGCAIGLPGMIEAGGLPGVSRMAGAALTRVVIGRFVCGMASGAIGKTRMIEVGR